MALDKGWHVAPTNNQDNHKGKWGNANDARDVIITDNFTEEGIYAAIRERHMYAPRIRTWRSPTPSTAISWVPSSRTSPRS